MTTSQSGAATDHPDPIVLLQIAEAPESVEPWMESTDPEPGLWQLPELVQQIVDQTSIIWRS